MKLNMHIRCLLIGVLAFPAVVHAQVSNDTAFNTLTSFEQSGNVWSDVAEVVISPGNFESFKKTSGNGIILAEAGNKESYLATKTAFGDTEIEFDFLVGKGTVSAVLLQGRYRLNLSDSWAQLNPSFNSMGGIGQQNAQDLTAFSGAAPLMNAAKAPGLWQHVRIRFKAPQFANGSKTVNALFEEVYINGCLVQQNMELQGPSAGSMTAREEATGPVVFYNSNGLLAIKNLKIRKIAPVTNTRFGPGGRRRPVNPIIITPEGSNYLLRSFLNFNNRKRTHVISVGSPRQVNYSYDLKQGALLQIWNGPFVDATEMWEQRGEPQLARPLGSIIPLSEAPALAVLQDANAAWPDSIAFDDFKTMGYTLDKQRNPSFEYETAGYHVWDKISLGNEGRSLLRELDITNAPANLYCRIANGSAINSLGKGWYVVGDKSYYIQVDEKLKPVIRNTSKGAELIVPVTGNKLLSYSLIW
jgi:hypothetical protein